jgi:type I restriction enzyme S subunit
MSEQGSKMLVPRLRFPEFRDAPVWEEKPLGELCEVLQGYGFPEVMQGKRAGAYPFCKVSDISRAVSERGSFIGEAANYEDADELKQLRAKPIPKGTTVFAKIGEALRLNRRALTQVECLIDNNAVGLKARKDKGDDYFIFLLSQTVDLNLYCGGAVPSVNKSTLESIEVLTPSLPEQQKIADCLSSLDELISAEAQQLVTLKAHKKGLMQQLFPAEGETVPKLRFPEFRDAGEWELDAIGAEVDLLSGYPFDGVEISENPKGTILLRGINITEGVVRHNKEIDRYYLGDISKIEKYKTETDDLVIAMDGSKVGKNVALITPRDAGALLVQRVARLRAKGSISIQFLFQQINSIRFQNYVDRINTSSGIPHISARQINEFEIRFPQFREQQKVADCLSSLDELIATQTQKLAAFKTHKKGLMQQLFPVMDEVGA